MKFPLALRTIRILVLVAASSCLLLAGPACTGVIDGGNAGVDDGSGGGTDPFPDPQASCECSDCLIQSIGVGAADTFDIGADDSEFVGLDSTGALIVDKRNSKYNRYLWVADTTLPGVVKIDLQSFSIVGRYRTPGTSTSRTTVNALGEAFVGARSGDTGVTKILPYGEDCPDTNGDGVITTSSGPNDVLAYGKDDCVAWHAQTEGDVRGLAAQDIPGTDPNGMCSDGSDTSIDIPDEHYVWAGGMHGKIYKIDASTGQILMTLDAPSPVYGMALSGDGKLWTVSRLAFLDTTRCTDEAACNAEPVCTQVCSSTDCADTCDGAIKANLSGPAGYGITVDCKNRVWMSGSAIVRYDPSGAVNDRHASAPDRGYGGIAADANGWIWASTFAGTTRLDAETLESVTINSPNKGVAVDSEGRIITVQNTGVHLIEPGATLEDYTLTKDVTALKGYAYAYSDMSGVQTRLASDEPGWYRHTFQGCEGNDATDWRVLDWDVETPPGTWAAFYARSADTVGELNGAPWMPVVSCAEGEGCLNLQHSKEFLQVEVRLSATPGTETGARGCSVQGGESAVIKRFDVRYFCSGAIL